MTTTDSELVGSADEAETLSVTDAVILLLRGGDIDTWGLVILDRLRAALGKHGKVSSLLMDRATLLKHRDAWVVEETQSVSDVHWLTEPERALYGELVENRHGHQIRLEQERIPIASVVAALGA